MSDRVHAASRPVNIETMHVIIAKTHPSSRMVLYHVNNSLARLKKTGAYDVIMARHLEQFWGATAAAASEASSQSNPDATNTRASRMPSKKTREAEPVPQQKPVVPGKKASEGKEKEQP